MVIRFFDLFSLTEGPKGSLELIWPKTLFKHEATRAQ